MTMPIASSLRWKLFLQGEVGRAGDCSVIAESHLVAAVAIHINARAVVGLPSIRMLEHQPEHGVSEFESTRPEDRRDFVGAHAGLLLLERVANALRKSRLACAPTK